MKDPSRTQRPSPFEQLLRPFQTIAQAEWAGGAVLLCATAIALLWANSPWAPLYHSIWTEELAITLGDHEFRGTFHALVNDGLLAVFFFVIGLEIKREFLVGELATWRRAALPLAAALGGLLVPAAIYMALTAGGDAARGWGIVMATDIAFAHGLFALLGQRAPVALGVFLAALAIVDDIGAIVVISIVDFTDVHWGLLALAGALLALAALANKGGVRSPWMYGSLGVALWLTIAAAGLHATVAGVLLAATIPVRRRITPKQFLSEAKSTLRHFERAWDPQEGALNNEERHEALQGLKTLLSHAQPPLVRIERALRGFAFVVILPIFAFANTGVSLGSDAVGAAMASPVALGVVAGLVFGKPLGIALGAWLAMRSGLADAPEDVSWPQILGVAFLGGIGFSISLYIARLSFVGNAEYLEAAQLGILAASLAAAGVGALLILRSRHQRSQAEAS